MLNEEDVLIAGLAAVSVLAAVSAAVLDLKLLWAAADIVVLVVVLLFAVCCC